MAGLAAGVTPASAQGGTVGGAGAGYYLNDSVSGQANTRFSYGDRSDQAYVGDWDGNGSATSAVRRGNTFYVKNGVTTGTADTTFVYGDPGDTVLVGNWDGQSGDTLVVRRGNTYFLRNSLTSGPADAVFSYGEATDTAFTSDWNGDGIDSIGVRRDPAPAPAPVPSNPGDSKNCSDFRTRAEAQAWFDTYYPAYGDVAGLDRDGNLLACEDLP